MTMNTDSSRKSPLRLRLSRKSSSSSAMSSESSSMKKKKKQQLFAKKREDIHRDRTEHSTHSELEDFSMSETEGNHSTFEEDDDYYDAFHAQKGTYAGSSSTSMTASLSGSLSQSGLSSQDSPTSSLKRNLEKPWMRESESRDFLPEDLFDLVEEDEDEDEPDMSSVFMSIRNLGAKSKSVAADLSLGPEEPAKPQLLSSRSSVGVTKRIKRAIKSLEDPKSSLSKMSYYMSKMRDFSTDDEGIHRGEIAQHGGIKTIVSALRQFLCCESPSEKENEECKEDEQLSSVYVLRLQQLGTATLANLARLPSLESKMVLSGATETVFNALKRYPRNSNLQEKGLDFVGALARLERGRESLAQNNDTVKIILSAMVRCSDDVYVQRRACIALYRLLAEGNDSCTTIGKSGAVEETLAAMKEHPKDAKIQKLGCGVLKALARRVDANKTRIVAKGGLATVLSAMTLHENDSGVQEEGCRFFGHLSMSHVERKFSIARSGALERILKAMEQFHDSSRVQVAGCVALTNLTSKLQIAQMANGHGALSIVKSAKPHSPHHASKLLTRLRLARYAPIVFAS